MIRKGGWVCQMCKAYTAGPEWRLRGAATQEWPVARQEQLLVAAGMRSLLPLGDGDGHDSINYECLQCPGAGADSIFGISEGIRLSWLHDLDGDPRPGSRRRSPAARRGELPGAALGPLPGWFRIPGRCVERVRSDGSPPRPRCPEGPPGLR
jgi:hypothetical protein